MKNEKQNSLPPDQLTYHNILDIVGNISLTMIESRA